jgi:threonine dehydrogenase-like Zn-dependent dehydrogenase
MRATVLYAAGDVRVEDVPDASLAAQTDAVVRVTHAAICGSDLWPYGSKPADSAPQRMGHEFIGVVEDTGAEVTGVRAGDLVLSPFLFEDNTCDFCRRGLTSSCRHGGQYGHANDGGQGEAVRVPQADGTLVRLDVEQSSLLMPSLLTLSDVFCTGHHAAVCGRVGPGSTVAVIGDGAVGLCAVLASRRLGAERIILLGRHEMRIALGREFGATDIVTERGAEGGAVVRELTGGDGVDAVLECVGHESALESAFAAIRDGGAISRVGVPQYTSGPIGMDMIMRNITLTGGIAPARAYIDQLLPDVLAGRIDPGKVFDRTLDLEHVPDGYDAMAGREALKVLITL